MFLQKLKNGMLPIAILTGCLCYPFFVKLAFLTPYLIFCMLLVTYCKITLRELSVSPLHAWLLTVQIAGSLLVYGLLRRFDPQVAEGTFICILAPTATAAVVITGLLGGNIASLATYSLLSNLAAALFAPLFFSFMSARANLPFSQAFWEIFRQVAPLLILPFITAIALQYALPPVHRFLKNRQTVSFYLWALALAIVMGRTTDSLIAHGGGAEELSIALFSLFACLLQFYTGRRIGRRYHNVVAAGQGLGQKNTILAIWMAQTYLHPLAAIGPSAYILWQNGINSWQLWKARKKGGGNR